MNDLTVHAPAADNDLIDLSADIVCAYVSHNALSVTDLPKLIADVREAGARIRLISDGDVAGAISACRPESGTDRPAHPSQPKS